MYPVIHLGPLEISTYFLVISLATTIGALWFLRRARGRGLSQIRAIDITLVCLLCGFAGARLLHVIYEEPEFYRASPLRVFEIWYGGFVFLGGLLGAVVGVLIFCRLRREPFLLWADLAALPVALTYALGRFACFLNGCCYGRYCELPWAITLAGTHRHPTQIYASLFELCSLGFLSKLEPRLKVSGTLFSVWLGLHAAGRLVMEYFRDDPRGELIFGASLGTWMSLGLMIFSVALWASLPAVRGPSVGPKVAH